MCAELLRVPADRWRRRHQERFLEHKALTFGKYTPPRPDWDHDHCEFRMAKFGLFPGGLTEGDSTTDDGRWICARCAADFEHEFGWTLRLLKREVERSQ